MTNVIAIFHLGLFFALLPPSYPKNQKKFLKKKKMPRDILNMCTKNYDQLIYGSWDVMCDRWTDGWTEKATYNRGECPT